MTLFLVKWDDGTFALVSATGEDDLIDTLDQLGDPGAASWQEYDGPLWLEFPRVDEELPAEREVQPYEIGLGRPVVAATEDGGEFVDAVLGAIHPNVAALRDRAIHQDRPISREELEKALKVDRDFALPGSIYGKAEGPQH